MSALLAKLLLMPRWLLVAAAAAMALISHAAAYHLGGAHEFRAGYAVGEAAAREEAAARRGDAVRRQLKDRLNAETLDDPHRGTDDGLHCGPSIRDCPP